LVVDYCTPDLNRRGFVRGCSYGKSFSSPPGKGVREGPHDYSQPLGLLGHVPELILRLNKIAEFPQERNRGVPFLRPDNWGRGKVLMQKVLEKAYSSACDCRRGGRG